MVAWTDDGRDEKKRAGREEEVNENTDDGDEREEAGQTRELGEG